jgi:hypothetical protein
MKTIRAFIAATLLSLGCMASPASASTVYFAAPRADPDRDGTSNLSSAEKRSYPNVPWFYYLGKTPEGYAYGTTKEDKLPEVPLRTLIQMADRLDELSNAPVIFGKDAMIKDIAARLRPLKIVFQADSHLPDGAYLTGPVPAASPLAPFNLGRVSNGVAEFGASTGDGKWTGNNWPGTGEMQRTIDLGVNSMRIPIRLRYCFNEDGTINTWVLNRLANDIKYNMQHGILTGLDAHEYKFFDDTRVARSWAVLAPAIEKAIGGPSPLLAIELSNEPGEGSKDLTRWTEPLRSTIRTIRASGYQGYILAGAGDWNNATFLDEALLTVEATGGVLAMDPYNRTIYTMHDYWNDGRNDQSQYISSNLSLAARYDPALAVGRRIGAKILMSEIGGGVTPTGPLTPKAAGGKDGRQIEIEYFAYAKANKDVLVGTWWWAGGDIGATYRHKVAAGNEHTTLLQGFWSAP